MTKIVLLLTAVLGFLLLSGCAAPAHIGTGTLDTLTVPLDFEPGAIFVTPDESYVLCETQREKNLLFSGNLEILKARALDYRIFAFSADSQSAAAIRQDEAVYVSVPDLSRLASFPKPAGTFTGKSELFALPDGRGYVAVSNDRSRPNVWIIGENPPRFADSSRSLEPETLRGAALDQTSGKLLLTNDRNHLEIFDLVTMKTEEVLELPCRETDYDLATALGWAFVATRDGMVIPVNIAARSNAAPIHMGGSGHVCVALSKSGRLLAVSHQDQSARKAPYPTTLKVFAVSDGNATELGNAFFEAKGPVRDIAVLETSGKVLISCTPQLLSWKFE